VRQVIHSFSICHFKVGVIDPFASTAVGSGLRIGEVHPAVTGVSRKKRARHYSLTSLASKPPCSPEVQTRLFVPMDGVR